QHKGQVRGLTTAAGLWCIAALGLATGFGMYLLSAMATLLILAALWILDYVEDMLPKVRYRTVTVRTKYRVGVTAEVVGLFKRADDAIMIFAVAFVSLTRILSCKALACSRCSWSWRSSWCCSRSTPRRCRA